jgi:predicted lipoprotein with Yx(FWY)xxD motif
MRNIPNDYFKECCFFRKFGSGKTNGGNMFKLNLLTMMIAILAAVNVFALELKYVQATTRSGKIQVKALENGMTLYVFDPDLGNAPTCNGDCAEVWPPILLTEKESLELTQNGLGSVKRSNGKIQLTLNGRPLYTYFADRLPGQAKGDGLGNVWHVIKAKE